MSDNATILYEPCGHKVTCKKCTLPALLCNGLRCSVCRTLVENLPKQFRSNTDNSVTIQTNEALPHVGVTLKNTDAGVMISALSKCDIGCKHLQKGDIIQAINGIPAVHHKVMITLINACSKSQTCMHIERTNNRSRISKHLRTLITKYYENCESFHPEWNTTVS
jgi:hypothetical protein